MNKQTFIASAVLTTLVGCATPPIEQNASIENDLSTELPASAAGISSEPLYFSSQQEAESALVGYNYGLTLLADGRVQAFVSGLNGSGMENPFEVVRAKSHSSAAKIADLAEAETEMAFPQITLTEKKNGQAAIDALGDKLGDVAKAYDMSGERLEDILRTDSSAWIDESGRLLYIDEHTKIPQGQGEQETATVTSSGSGTASIATTDPFALHSKPGSNRVIYLDFNGHVATNTAWSTTTLNAQAYDIDGNPGAFSGAELNNIREIWQRVAEDYAPFDVDVTTQEPTLDALRRTSTSDIQYGTRAVVTRSMPQLCNQTCGGVAYVNVFSYYSAAYPERYRPAWVFFDKLGNGYPKYVAEAISHEVGHNLNLNHDGNATTGYYTGQGSGATGWAPIMGVGYYKPVSQWSKGEYPGANNLQDDLAVINAAGAAVRPDDFADTTAGAAPLAGDSSAVSQNGIIERTTDADVFVFSTGGGSAQFNVTPDTTAPNLDVLLKLLDAQGNTVAQANPVDSLAASLNVSLNAGKYFLRIEGVGKGDLITGYSDYGSLGQYQITGNYPVVAAVPPAAVISALPTVGDAPLNVTLNGSGSSARSGSISSYAWNFGDGSAATSGASVSHIYNTPGAYTATLTVTDSSGLKTSTSQSIQAAQSVVAVNMKVASTVVTRKLLSGGKSQCVADIAVKSGISTITGASIYGTWSGSVTSGTTKTNVTGTSYAITGTKGTASLSSALLPSNSKGTCAFTVTKVVKSGYLYDGSGAISRSLSW
ncbi:MULTISPECIES: PKD domain-containing protein [Methylomonas]|uniref:PKD domain-containing protein n=2 Tax=Methylomonas TaxID=416 RepID=A0A126T4K7_9GAMM|nr:MULTISPECIES: PKD domain-containing protein [Methylomonas]AMK76664.1 PKD domain-containing protein [Methylomonas denitrificans]OAH97245.1 PKD domain-containing protein [Methylomonas methanica]TCV82845.1 PKD domain-containing protein [Methylomonas methanica]